MFSGKLSLLTFIIILSSFPNFVPLSCKFMEHLLLVSPFLLTPLQVDHGLMDG